MIWQRMRPGLYRVLATNGRGMVERGEQTGVWWWLWQPRGGDKHDRLHGREMLLVDAKAIVEAVAKQDAAEEVPF